MDGSDRTRVGAAHYGAGAAFWKVSGSGNDFVAFDRMDAGPAAELPRPDVVRALCRRGLGVGADGVMVLRPAAAADYELVYFNADGSRAELCGNASLCSVRLAVELGHASRSGVTFRTDAGPIAGRVADGLPEVDLAPPTELLPDRLDLAPDGPPPGDRIGYARVGVPHVVIRCADADAVDLERASPHFRHHPALRDGANVNFASRSGGRVVLRTFERGVEAETLACGTGSVATALLLAAWDSGQTAIGTTETEIVTRSGLRHRVRTAAAAAPGGLPRVSLAGTARLVFRATLGDGDWG